MNFGQVSTKIGQRPLFLPCKRVPTLFQPPRVVGLGAYGLRHLGFLPLPVLAAASGVDRGQPQLGPLPGYLGPVQRTQLQAACPLAPGTIFLTPYFLCGSIS